MLDETHRVLLHDVGQGSLDGAPAPPELEQLIKTGLVERWGKDEYGLSDLGVTVLAGETDTRPLWRRLLRRSA